MYPKAKYHLALTEESSVDSTPLPQVSELSSPVETLCIALRSQHGVGLQNMVLMLKHPPHNFKT